MSIEKIITKIKEDGEKKARKILSEARGKAKEIIEKEQIEINKEKEIKYSKGKKEIETKKNIIISTAKRNTRKKILETKEEIINNCFVSSKESLENLDEENYNKILTKQILEAKNVIGDDLIVIPSRDKDISFLNSQNFTIGDIKEATGGVTLVSKDGKISIENTFDGIMERLRDDVRIGVAKILFLGD